MAREFAKVWFSLFTDEEFARQDAGDKWLYIVLLGQPALNYAGVQPMNLRRWRKACATDQGIPSELEIKARLLRLERGGYVFVDEDTGEVLARSFIRNDQVSKQPNVFKSALRAVAQIESPKLAAVLRDEMGRVAQPEVKNEKLEADLRSLRITAESHLERVLEGLPEGFAEGFPEPFTEDFPEGFPRPGAMEPFREGFPEGFREGSVVVEVEVATTDPALKVGKYACEDADSPTGTPSAAPEATNPDYEPPSRCAQHRALPPDALIPPCGPCANFRKAHERWQHNAAAAAKEHSRRTAVARRQQMLAQADVERDAIDRCAMCDDRGYRIDRAEVCNHQPVDRETAQRHISEIRSTLAKEPA